MSTAASTVRSFLESGDAVGLGKLTGLKVKTRHDMLKILHMARTQTQSIDLAKRQYSHRWLKERGLPSMLPEKDHPPEKAVSVGIAVKSAVPVVQVALHDAMRDAVLVAYADGEKDPKRIKALMMEAKERELRGLMLALGERAK